LTDQKGGAVPDNSPRAQPELGDFFFLGTSCAVSVVGAGAGGYGLDAWLHTTPWLTFAGLAFGIVSAVLLCVVQIRKSSEQTP
jgi:F0F1-type ATP synthase assembly protein I